MLSIVGYIYGRVAAIRNTFYEKGVFKSYDLGRRVISIGNITAGGTGKTPLTALVARILSESGQKVCILTRGYGRRDPKQRVLVSDGQNIHADAQTGGDEPVELAKMLIGRASVIADPDRLSASKWAVNVLDPSVFLLDDGFQHRRAKRDVDIVCIDATDPFGGGKILPAGRLREPLVGLKRADVIVITRADLADDVSDTERTIRELAGDKKIFLCESVVMGFVRLEDFHSGLVDPRSAADLFAELRYGVFCGLGNSDNFFRKLEEYFDNFESPLKAELLFTKAFRDHNNYSRQDIDLLNSSVSKSGSNTLFTTAKDAVKLKDVKFSAPCYVVISEPVINNPVEFERLIIS